MKKKPNRKKWTVVYTVMKNGVMYPVVIMTGKVLTPA